MELAPVSLEGKRPGARQWIPSLHHTLKVQKGEQYFSTHIYSTNLDPDFLRQYLLKFQFQYYFLIP